MSGIVEIKGLREFQRALKDMDRDLPKQIRVVLNASTKVVTDYAVPKIPRVSGRGAGSVKAKSSQREARVSLGGRRAAYMPWVDFGGQGRKPGRPAPRPFLKRGRYLYAGLDARHDEFTKIMEAGLKELAAGAGLDMD